jgi:Arc/MetJ family transcription regulator
MHTKVMDGYAYPMHITDMRTTINIDDDLIARARELTGIQEKTALVREALKSLIAEEAGKRLIALGGTMPGLQQIPRRRLPPRDED